MADKKNVKKDNGALGVVGQIGAAAVRGAARGGGLISAPFRAAQVGVGTVRNVSRGMQTYNQRQEKANRPAPVKKPAKPAAPKPVAKPAPAKPMNTKPVSKPVAKPAAAPKKVAPVAKAKKK